MSEEIPYIYIQWKGGPCIDSHCICGFHGHRCDAEFMYTLVCPKCDRAYNVPTSLKLELMSEAEKLKNLDYLNPMHTEEDEVNYEINGVSSCFQCDEPKEKCMCKEFPFECRYPSAKSLKEENEALREKIKKLEGQIEENTMEMRDLKYEVHRLEGGDDEYFDG